MIIDWSRVDPDMLTARFDLYVITMCALLQRRLVPPDIAARSLELRTDVLDIQLAHVAAAKN